MIVTSIEYEQFVLPLGDELITVRIRPGPILREDVMAEQMELKLWPDVSLEPTQVEWIVNDLAELGVRIGGRCYFLYKGRSMEYPDGERPCGNPT